MTNKTKIIIANVLIIFGFLCVVCGFVMIFIPPREILGIVLMFVAGVISMIVGAIFWKHSNHPEIEQPKVDKPNKQRIHKSKGPKKHKKPFISDEEWEELDEEEEEEMYV